MDVPGGENFPAASAQRTCAGNAYRLPRGTGPQARTSIPYLIYGLDPPAPRPSSAMRRLLEMENGNFTGTCSFYAREPAA